MEFVALDAAARGVDECCARVSLGVSRNAVVAFGREPS